MQNELKIEEQFVVDGKTFYSKEEAQEYIEKLQKLKQEKTKNDFHESVYYENWTTLGEEAERQIIRARWQTFKEAFDAMDKFANSLRPMGTGWIIKVTISTDNENRVRVKNERVYENM